MKALCWYGTEDVRVETVPDPKILNPRDAIIKVTTAAICGSDLHLYNGNVPTLEKGDILGHEFMGEVVEVGKGNRKLNVGDRVVVPFAIACGNCFYCRKEAYSLCDNSNPNAVMQQKITEFPTAGLFGYTHLYGGYAGGQAEYVRVPYADVGPIRVPDDLTDEQVLFLGDIFPTAYHAAINGNIPRGDVVAVWGCGPVGVHPDRVDTDIGMDADEHGPAAAYEKVKQTIRLQLDRPFVLREAIRACRNGGTISFPGVYVGYIDKMPFGIAFGKALQF